MYEPSASYMKSSLEGLGNWVKEVDWPNEGRVILSTLLASGAMYFSPLLLCNPTTPLALPTSPSSPSSYLDRNGMLTCVVDKTNSILPLFYIVGDHMNVRAPPIAHIGSPARMESPAPEDRSESQEGET